MTYVTKGTRVRVTVIQINDPLSALSGAQLKFGGTRFVFDGTVRHVRAASPTSPPQDVRFWVQPDLACPGLRTVRCEKCSVEEVVMLHQSTLSVIPPSEVSK
jgi:hypothetical protein